MDHHTAALLAAGKHLSDALTSFEAPPADPLITSLWVAMSLLQKDYRRVTKKNMPRRWFDVLPHTHVALDDAIEQGALFCNMLAESRRV